MKGNAAIVGIASIAITVTACSRNEHYIVASTGTVIGVEIQQSPVNQTPQAKLGYDRAEIAIVPTNRGSCVVNGSGVKACTATSGGGAVDAADVLMELRYGGIFSLGHDSGIYQRLAVGSNAVKQPGATLMFARETDGSISPGAAQLAAQAKAEIATEDALTDKAVACVSKADGSIDAGKRDALADELVKQGRIDKATATVLKTVTTAQGLRTELTGTYRSLLPHFKSCQ